MEPHPFDPHFHLRSKLEEEILELESRLQTLRLKRNALLPISSLPEEVLVEIFLLANTSNKSGLVVSGWIVKMGWVCHTWRKLALDHPLLWTEITEELCERWTREFLKRSGSAVIHLEICHDEEQEDLIASIPQELHRIRHLKLVNAGLNQDVVHPILTTPAPILQSLDLWEYLLPQNLFSGVFPSLRILKLWKCDAFNLDNLGALSQLTQLNLHYPIPNPSFQVFLLALASFPYLQRLILQSPFDPDDKTYIPSDSRPPLPYIRLPNLDYISWSHCGIRPMGQLINHIIAKEGATARILNQNHRTLSKNIRGFRRQDFEMESIHISFTHSDFILCSLNPSHGPIAKVRLLAESLTPGQLEDILHDLDNGNALASLRSLILDGWKDHNGRNLSNSSRIFPLFSAQPNIHTMKLGCVYAVSFVEYVATLHPQIPTSSSTKSQTSANNTNDTVATITSVPFQSLRFLSLKPHSPDQRPDSPTLRSFLQVLKARKQTGIGLEELSVNPEILLQAFDSVSLTECADRLMDIGKSE